MPISYSLLHHLLHKGTFSLVSLSIWVGDSKPGDWIMLYFFVKELGTLLHIVNLDLLWFPESH